ncbi:hypothetical protein POX_a01486 [Penicillium oxalicum]|uniref:hypothetical protein n=1 Tax=Penicillium oxalicum TaxID=69781 RepID=UPI0020B8E10B|nr:hypothetical protein POX_a01486 [Penicillium oxalicum]KAI2794885.1 hypothetical protein POX_a01486 [Penicillium oxalicum]
MGQKMSESHHVQLFRFNGTATRQTSPVGGRAKEKTGAGLRGSVVTRGKNDEKGGPALKSRRSSSKSLYG